MAWYKVAIKNTRCDEDEEEGDINIKTLNAITIPPDEELGAKHIGGTKKRFMEQVQESSNRGQYEKRGIAVPAEIQGRGPGESTLATLHRQLVKRYGEGWEVDSVYPGTICDNAQGTEMGEGHMVIFKRRRQLRDE